MEPPLARRVLLADITGAEAVVLVANLNDFSLSSLMPHLNDAERLRAQRFRKEKDSQRYVLAHYCKRFLLSQYLSIPMHELQFDSGAYGKPFCILKNAPYFNLSHSGDWVALAISVSAEVGVDVEFPRQINHEVVKKVSSDEQFVRYQNSDDQMAFFLNIWTQKEAVSKACGRGISVGLSDIPCSGELGVQSIAFRDTHYCLRSYLLPDGGVLSYAATVALEPAIIRIRTNVSSDLEFFAMF